MKIESGYRSNLIRNRERPIITMRSRYECLAMANTSNITCNAARALAAHVCFFFFLVLPPLFFFFLLNRHHIQIAANM